MVSDRLPGTRMEGEAANSDAVQITFRQSTMAEGGETSKSCRYGATQPPMVDRSLLAHHWPTLRSGPAAPRRSAEHVSPTGPPEAAAGSPVGLSGAVGSALLTSIISGARFSPNLLFGGSSGDAEPTFLFAPYQLFKVASVYLDSRGRRWKTD